MIAAETIPAAPADNGARAPVSQVSPGLGEMVHVRYIPDMDEWQPMSQAAESAKVSRNTVARWVSSGLLKSRKGKVRNLTATLVNVAAVKELAKTRRPGRPKGDGKGKR